jgi:hypothetical protein
MVGYTLAKNLVTILAALTGSCSQPGAISTLVTPSLALIQVTTLETLSLPSWRGLIPVPPSPGAILALVTAALALTCPTTLETIPLLT